MTLGGRDGAPFFHCHALWREADGRTMAATSCPRKPWSPSLRGRSLRHRRRGVHRGAGPRDQFQAVRADALRGTRMQSRPAAPSRCGCGRTRILPARWKRSAGSTAFFARRIHGGVGSTIGARFTDGRSVDAVCDRTCGPLRRDRAGADGALEAELDVALVDYLGGLAEGRLSRGDNPVLMTMELVLEVLGEARP